MRWLCLLTGFLVLGLQPVLAGHSAPRVVLRVHVQSPGAGQSPMEVTTISLPPQGEQIQIRTLAEVNETELVGVAVDPATGGLRLQFNHIGQVNLSAVTAENQGRVMVVFINGVIVYAPVIDEQITNGELDIPHRINPQVVQLLQELVQRNLKQAART